MSGQAEMHDDLRLARSLYLELRAWGLRVHVEDDPGGEFMDYRISVFGLERLSEIHARRLKRRIAHNEVGLVQVITGCRDPDLRAIRAEGFLSR